MLANPYAISFLVLMYLALAAKYAYKAVSAGWRMDAAKVATQTGVLDPHGRTTILFGRIGAAFLPKNRVRLFEYRGGQVAVSDLTGNIVARGVLTKVSARRRQFFPRVRFDILLDAPHNETIPIRGVLTHESLSALEAAGATIGPSSYVGRV